jgi:hypothetical protein
MGVAGRAYSMRCYEISHHRIATHIKGPCGFTSRLSTESGELMSRLVIVCQPFVCVTLLRNFASLRPHFTRGVDDGMQAARIFDGAPYIH